MSSLGENIRKIRNEKEISTEKLGAKIGISSETIFLIERGKTKNPSIDTLQKIASALDVTIDELLKK